MIRRVLVPDRDICFGDLAAIAAEISDPGVRFLCEICGAFLCNFFVLGLKSQIFISDSDLKTVDRLCCVICLL